MKTSYHYHKKILATACIGVAVLTGITLLAFLLLSDAFRPTPVVEITPDNTYTETLRVVTDIDYEPFSYVDENGSYTGLDVELIAEIANRLQMNLNLTLLDWTKANDTFFAGQADAFLNMETDLISEDDRMLFTLPTAEKQYVVYGRETVSSVSALFGKKVASLHHLPELGLNNIDYFDSYAEIFDALNRGDYDFAICPIQVGNIFLEKLQMTDVKPSYAVSHIYGAIALHAGRDDLKERIDTVISDLEREGFLSRLDEKWISNRYQSMTLTGMIRSHPTVGAGFVAGLLLLAFLVFFLVMQGRRNEELRIAKERAEESSNAKTMFLSNMSHEIRTPINAVLGMNEMILRTTADGAPSEDRYREIASCATNVENAGRQLLSIINDILDFSKIDAGKMEVLPAAYRLSSVINDVSTIASFRAKDKGLALNIDVEKTLPDNLYGDEVRLKQVLTNVLGNAVKYTKEGAVSFTVTGEKETDERIHLRFRIEDTGIGIREEDIGRLFDQFERMEREKNKTIEGTGLGLAITKRLVDLMDGEIAVESVYGEGSVFTVSIPQKVLAGEEIGDFHEKFLHAMEERPRYREVLHAPDAEILVVDDTEMNLTVVEGLLTQTKVHLDTALSGAEALEKTQRKHYDLIFMDQMMPQMDGAEALHLIREQDGGQNRDTPVICLTADAVSGARERYLAEGFTDYLSKPVEGRALENALKTYLPAEKVTLQTREDTQESMTQDDQASALKQFYKEQTILNYEEALRLCGSEAVLEKTLKQFYAAVDTNADAIGQFLETQDYKNYTIKVHALKSSARLIGADALSEKAKYLEACGKDLTKAHQKEIAEETPALLTDYRELEELLAAYCREEDTAFQNAAEMTQEQWQERISAIREAADVFDSDAVDEQIEEARHFRIPAQYEEAFAKIADAAAAMDWEALEDVLRGL